MNATTRATYDCTSCGFHVTDDSDDVDGFREVIDAHEAEHEHASKAGMKPVVPLVEPPVRGTIDPGHDWTGGPTDDGLVAVAGHCMPWCANDGPAEGETVEDHGLWCVSHTTSMADGRDAAGHDVGISVELVSPYRHGMYRTPKLRTETWVRW